MTHADSSLNENDDDIIVEKLAGGFLRGILKVTGLALMAVIAGYSAGIAQENYRASRAKTGYRTADAHQ
jgi:hypothetical protein